MKTRNLLLLLSSLLVLSGCNEPVTPPVEEEETKGVVVINPFDNDDDLYRSKQLLDQLSYGVDCELKITNEVVHSGDGALEITYNNSIYGQIYQRNALSPIKDEDMSDVYKLGGWFYNDNDFETTLTLNVVGKETSILSSYEVDFPSKEWINPVYTLNMLVMNAIQDDVRGFSFKIGKCQSYPATFYADELYVEFGQKPTAEDTYYLSQIDEIIKLINELPEVIKATDTASIAKCKEIAAKYSAVPYIYQPAVTNYQTFVAALKTYNDSIADATATDSDVIAYHFDTCFGLAQTSFLTSHIQFPITLSTEKKFGDEEASTKLSLTGKATWYEFNAVSSINMQNYEYIEFSLYNDTPAKIAFCLMWDTTHIAEAGKWTTFRVPTNYAAFRPTYLIEWEFTGNDNDYYGDGLPHPIIGDIYLSQVTLHRASASKFIEMVNNLPSVIDESCEAQVQEIRRFYESLHKDEKGKISEADYNKLLQAEHDVKASYIASLASLIDSLPDASNIKAYNGTYINKAYSVYSIMSQSEKETLLTSAQRQKLEELYVTYITLYDTVLDAADLAGENIGISWDVRANGTHRIDPTYGDVIDYSLSKFGNRGLDGAFEMNFGNVDVSEFKKITFFVKPAHNDEIYLSRSAWRGGDSSKGFALQQSITANVWNEVVIDASDFAECSYLEFYFYSPLSLGDTYSITSFYGVKK